ncbi:MAG TPA: hypothetical protein VMV82_05335 [Candidatus Dormibacteraeota bacterium]|nr:hypothetical protein [Candidatus Dormibacteraeota bacterium]
MLRYFVIATVLVVGTLVAATAYHEYRLRIVVGSGKGYVPPKPAASLAPGHRIRQGLRGDAAWALSALPECMIQIAEWKGRREALTSHLPFTARAVAAPAVLRYGDCAITVVDDEAYVRRGHDRLRIPPHVRFYLIPGGIATLRAGCTAGSCAAVLRVYRTARAAS